MKRLWYFLPLLVIVLIILSELHPYLSPSEPLKKGVLVAEGWMEQEAFADVATVFSEGNYAQILTTGTIRPFSYYLNNQQRLYLAEVSTAEVVEFELEASGLRGAHMVFIQGNDTLFDTDLNEKMTAYSFHSTGHKVDSLTIKTYSTVATDWNFRISFLKSFKVNGKNAHSYFERVVHINRLGDETLGARTYAESAVDKLRRWGIPTNKVIVIPTLNCSTKGRTKCNAACFAQQAEKHKWNNADLITLGVHARRSHTAYKAALPANFNLGIISIEDPAYEAGNWLFEPLGRQQVLKELGGMFFDSAED